jgi:hypothetical protein
MNIQFSLVCPSIRPQFWNETCSSLLDNKLNWEILFIGPLPPTEPLNLNARWINATCKPAQCTHIGFQEAKGEYVSITADDAVYFTPNHKGALDNMYDFIKKFPKAEIHQPSGNPFYNKDKMAYGFRMFEDQFCAETSHTHFLTNDGVSPQLFPFFVIANGVYQELGGYDNRFITGQAENDLLFRIWKAYGSTKNSLCPTAMIWALHDKHGNAGSFRKYHSQDFGLLKKLWIANGSSENLFSQERNDKNIESYINNDAIYTKSQGEVGEWQ